MDTPEIDEKLRKPRQLRGSPANRFSVFFSLGVVGLGCVIGLITNFVPVYANFRRGFLDGKYLKPSDEQLTHEELMRERLKKGIIVRPSTADRLAQRVELQREL